jgi:hypothetical protein
MGIINYMNEVDAINRRNHDAGLVVHCEHCVWDGVAYWDNNHKPIAQWISCEVCDWGNE